jgi:hypothetical protein
MIAALGVGTGTPAPATSLTIRPGNPNQHAADYRAVLAGRQPKHACARTAGSARHNVRSGAAGTAMLAAKIADHSGGSRTH